MYDSDGAGLGALCLLFPFLVYAIGKIILDNILWFILGVVIIIVLLYFWNEYGYNLKIRAERWCEDKILRLLFNIFGMNLYHNKLIWYSYRSVTGVIRMIAPIYIFFLGIKLVDCII